MGEVLSGPGGASGKIGRQIVLPFSKAFEIAWKGIRIRIWRSLITMSGIILAIAFLMSVWTSGAFTRALRGVEPEHDLYVLAQGVLEAEAIATGGVSIHCAVLEGEDAEPVAGTITPGNSVQRFLNAQEAFRADLLPDNPRAVLEQIQAEAIDPPDALILIGLPGALRQAGAAEAVARYVREGGMVIFYGDRGLVGGPEAMPEAVADLLPASPSEETFSVLGGPIQRLEHVAATGVLWDSHPAASFRAAAGRPDALSLARTEEGTLVWLRSVGQGVTAWYPVAGASAEEPDVVSWFLRSRTVDEPGKGDPRTSPLVKLVAEGARQKLRGSQADTRGVWLVSLSLMVCVVGITNAMLMSVTERFREIGTMKCLGALDKFVVKLFLIESSLQGVVGSLAGAVVGFLLAFARALFTFHVAHPETGQSHWLALRFFPAASLMGWLVIALGVGVVLSVVAAIYPAIRAARMEPVQAMRAEA